MADLLEVRERPDGSVHLMGTEQLRGFHYILGPDDGLSQALAVFLGLYREALARQGEVP